MGLLETEECTDSYGRAIRAGVVTKFAMRRLVWLGRYTHVTSTALMVGNFGDETDT